MAGLHFDITGDNSNFLRKLEEARNGVRNTSRQIEESGLSIEKIFGRLTTAAATFGISLGAQQLISDIARVRGEFQQLEVAFQTMLGNKGQADTLMSQLVRTAAITPFNLQDVANGAKQLLAYGTEAKDVNDTLYNPQIQISAESETKRSIFREKDKTKRSKKESAQHSKSRNKSFVMTSVSAL